MDNGEDVTHAASVTPVSKASMLNQSVSSWLACNITQEDALSIQKEL